MSPRVRERTLRAAAARAAGIDFSSDPQQHMLPLEHMPVIVRDHGVCEAHTRPLVGRRRADDSIRSWRSEPRHAWIQPLVEWTRTGNSYPAVAFDIDAQEGIEVLGAANMGCADDIPTPNLSIYRRKTGHAHAVYTLKRPVHRGAKARPYPLGVLGRCSEWLLTALRADSGFTGVLVANPVHDDYETVWTRREPYTLDELRSFIPDRWRRPRVARTDVGRNYGLFRTLLRYAGVESRSDAEVRVYGEQLGTTIDTEHPHAFTHEELHGIIRSVLRRRAEWRSRTTGWHKPDWIEAQARAGRKNSREQQAAKGVRSGESRRDRTQERDERILQHLKDGSSTRQVAAREGISQPRVVQIRDRAKGDKRTTTQVDRGVGFTST